jgi:predicted RNA-binding protein associated with RNAse of E/G family
VSPPSVVIHYRRLPDREQIFEQIVLDHSGDQIVTFLESAELSRAVEVQGRVVLEPGSPVVWFTFPHRWHDVGRFHLRDGTFTGFYANILTPVVMTGTRWETTDLCLDVWSGNDGVVEILDEDEFAEARGQGWLDEAVALRAVAEAQDLASAAREGRWPPPDALEWGLDRALHRLRELGAANPDR